MLDKVALFVIFFLVILFAAAIVIIGSIPGNIAKQRNHPWPQAVNAASWIGLATGVFWPVALIWAYIPVPAKPAGTDSSASDDTANSSDDAADLRKKVAELESAIKSLQAQQGEPSA